MSRVGLVFVVFLSFSLPLFAQSVDTAWVRRYNGPGNGSDEAYAIAVDDSGYVNVTGKSLGSGTDDDYATIRYYPDGDTAWVRRYNGPGNFTDKAFDIATDVTGNIYVAGLSGVLESALDCVTIKYNSNGDTVWTRIYDGVQSGIDVGSVIAVDSFHNIYVAGQSEDIHNYPDFLTIKYDSTGTEIWAETYGYDHSDEVTSIAVDDLGNVYVTGISYISASNPDYATIKYYPTGDTAWVRRFDRNGKSDWAYAIAVDDSGCVYITGTSDGGTTGSDYDCVTIKYRGNGDTAWVRTYEEPESGEMDLAEDLALDKSGNVYVAVTSYTDATKNDYVTIKYYTNGDTAWIRRYDADGKYDYAEAMAVDDSGNVYVTGYSDFGSNNYDYATIKYDSLGNELWAARYNFDAIDFAYDIRVDSDYVYVTGRSQGSGTGFDYATIKYGQFKRGDVNEDDDLSVSDVVYLINYLFKGGPAPGPIILVGDANCDSQVTVSDVVYLINYLFKGGPPLCV